jgi:8-oxo-dGTP pyrophosphatase MutT (NUDIX family)
MIDESEPGQREPGQSEPDQGEPGQSEPDQGEPGRREPPKRRRRGRRPAGATRAAGKDAGQPATADARSGTPAKKTARRQGSRARLPQGAAAKKAQAAENAPAKGPVHREVSAGGVVYRRDGDSIEVVLASRRTRRGELAWGLAKGGIEEGESLEDAAVREVREETGIEAEIEDSLGDTRYFYVWEDTRIRKTVHFFLMRATGGDPLDRDDEMEEIRWFPIERALKRAAYRGERDVIGRALDRLR